jgi:hypothetical protein
MLCFHMAAFVQEKNLRVDKYLEPRIASYQACDVAPSVWQTGDWCVWRKFAEHCHGRKYFHCFGIPSFSIKGNTYLLVILHKCER